MSRAKPTSDLDRSRILLDRLGWTTTSERLPELVEQGVRENMTLISFLDLVAQSETSFREEKRVKTWLKHSRLPIGKTLEDFDFMFNRAIDRSKIDMLATCEFARRKENVLLLGPSGTGKTHIAASLGVKTVQNGFSTAFFEADTLIDMFRRKDISGSNRRPRYLGCHVLIIDELGFQALDRRDAHRLFQLVNFRYERASTIITSNKSITEWPVLLAGDESLATAILDRLLHHCHVLQMDGPSYRLRRLEQQIRLEPRALRTKNEGTPGPNLRASAAPTASDLRQT
jgi:DNA replication protein DnaC